MLRAALSLLLLLSSVSAKNETDLSVADIKNLNDQARKITDSFYQNSFDIRMRYEFANQFLSENDRLELYFLSKSSSQKIITIIGRLKETVVQIESYNGTDWQQRFGQTGLYQNALNYLLNAQLSKLGVDYYSALTSPYEQKTSVADELLKQIDLLSNTHNPFYLDLVKCKTLALLAATNNDYLAKAVNLSNSLYGRSDTNHLSALLASVERAKLKTAGKNNSLETDRLTKDILDNQLTDNPEIILPLAFLQRRLDNTDNYEKLLNTNLYYRNIAAKITLGWLEAGNEPVNKIDAELASEAALVNEPEKHIKLLSNLAADNSASNPVVHYAAALANLQTNKKQAIKLMLKASKSQDTKPNPNLGLSAVEIAERAAVLAYDFYLEDSNNCEFAAGVFYNYRDLADDNIDEELEWKFVQLHLNDFDATAGYQGLERVRERGEKYSSKASLYIAAHKVRVDEYKQLDRRQSLLKEFAENFHEPDDCIFSSEASYLISNTLEWFESLQLDKQAKNIAIRNCTEITKFLLGCDEAPELRLMRAECLLLKTEPNEADLRQVEFSIADMPPELISTYAFTRCRARFAFEQKDFAGAAFLWGKLAQQIKLNEQNQSQPSWQWWRAKYYQLESAARTEQNRSEISHTLDVLRATYKDIPQPWNRKLESLHRELGQ